MKSFLDNELQLCSTVRKGNVKGEAKLCKCPAVYKL